MICVSTCVCVMYMYNCMCVYDTLRKVLADCFDDEAMHQNNITEKKYFSHDGSSLYLNKTHEKF